MKKSFKLTCEDGWPPADVENLWLTPTPDGMYIVESSPFFVKGLALGDEIELHEDDNGDVIDFSVRIPSENSTVWLLCENEACFEEVASDLKAENFPAEGFPDFRLFSIVVAKTKQLLRLEALVEGMSEQQHVELAYPCLRHEE